MPGGSGSQSRGRRIVCALAVLATSCCWSSVPAWAGIDDPVAVPARSKRIVGWVERVNLLPDDVPVHAKLDTGARTSSIHAEGIGRFERDGEDWVRFTLVLEDPDDVFHRVPLERPIHRDVRIKDHDDASDHRPVVELEFCFDGRVERAQFSLTDRSTFIYPVLLGRRFLARRFVVDPSETFTAEKGCPDPDDGGESEK
jgi:hypothetical protein